MFLYSAGVSWISCSLSSWQVRMEPVLFPLRPEPVEARCLPYWWTDWTAGSEDDRAARNGGSRRPGYQRSCGLWWQRQTLGWTHIGPFIPAGHPHCLQEWIAGCFACSEWVPAQNAAVSGAAVIRPWIGKEANKGQVQGTEGLGFTAGERGNQPPCDGYLNVWLRLPPV